MTLPVFAPARPPGLSSRQTTSYRVREAGFGDGSVQRAQDGLNAATVSWELSWQALPLDDANDIKAFMDARGGWQAFLYTVPGDVERKYRNGQVVKAHAESGLTATISVTLTEVHDS